MAKCISRGEELGKIRTWVNYILGNNFESMVFYGFLVVSKHLGHFRQANRWSQPSPIGTAPRGRHAHTAVWSDVADGMYVFGGGVSTARVTAEHAAALHSFAEESISMTSTFMTARRREDGI